MRSMYRFSIIALAVASLALVAAGAAFGAAHEGKGVKISGAITGGFGQTTAAPAVGDSSSNLTTQSEAVVDFGFNAGAVSGKYRIETNEKAINNLRNMVRWQVNDMIGLQFNGQSFGSQAGADPFGATVVGFLTAFGGPGNYGGYAMWSVGGVNNSDFDINFKLQDGMNAGIVLSGDYNLTGGAGTDTEKQTMVPYFNGKFGAIAVHVYAASASAKDTAGDSRKANETGLTGIWKGDGMQFSLSYMTGKYNDATKTTGMALSGRVAGISFHYITDVEDPDAGGDATKDITDIAVAYTAPINDGASWSIGYGATTDNVEGGSTTDVPAAASQTPGNGIEGTSSQIIFGVQGKF